MSGRNIKHGRHNKIALECKRVRQQQFRVSAGHTLKINNVNVERPRPIRDRTNAPKLAFNRLQLMEQGERLKRWVNLRQHYRIAELSLILEVGGL
jgi:hypothetical protein